MTRWAVTGAGGLLGLDLQVALALSGVDEKSVTALTHADLDVTDRDAVREAVRGHDVVVNCAAVSPAEGGERDEPAAFAVNAVGAANVAAACRETGTRLVHVSCHSVFSGDSDEPYAEDAPLAPRSAYGRTKAAGEWAVEAHCHQAWIVRTGWLYGGGAPNVVKEWARLAASGERVPVAEDQHGQPTWTMDVAEAVLRLVGEGAPFGVWHATSRGETSLVGFARAVLEGLGHDPDLVEAVRADGSPEGAPRRIYGVLGHDAWRMARLPLLPDWRESLAAALPDVVAPGAPEA
ncbi:NAD(P)-dependent oxidoreductase [Phycicoccus sp. 3266]|uniref:SDR family oxidoreductase n=1 Tax=Phycicoccus sp. 3266 TaxID=2817751 RepID=UPI00286703E3|nr:NAD(P)-dependent oxidoreductase [Phycicoccus sp. 3266]MDR6864152.1 dTDP-4-dehydrorhamnose reductase [Phycicoccus sp. 3266]